MAIARAISLALGLAGLLVTLLAGSAVALAKEPPMPALPEQILEWDGCLQFRPEKEIDKSLDDYLRVLFDPELTEMSYGTRFPPTLAVSSVNLAGSGKRDLLVSLIHGVDCTGGCQMVALLHANPREKLPVLFTRGDSDEEDIPCVKELPPANGMLRMEVKGEILSLCDSNYRGFDRCEAEPP